MFSHLSINFYRSAAIVILLLALFPYLGICQESGEQMPPPRIEIRRGEIALKGNIKRINATARMAYVDVNSVYHADGTSTMLSASRGKVILISVTTQLIQPDSPRISGKNTPDIEDFNGEQAVIVGKDTGAGKPLPAREILGWPAGSKNIVDVVPLGPKSVAHSSLAAPASPLPLAQMPSDPPDTSNASWLDTCNWIINTIDKLAVVRNLNGEDVHRCENATFDGTELDYTCTTINPLLTTNVELVVPFEKLDPGSIVVEAKSEPPVDDSDYAKGQSVDKFYEVNAQTLNAEALIENTLSDSDMVPMHGAINTFAVDFSDLDTASRFVKALRHAIRLSKLVQQKPLF